MPVGDETAAGGFLLGASEEQYRGFIEQDQVLVLEGGSSEESSRQDSGSGLENCLERSLGSKENEIIGFSIVLKDATVRQSEIWQKRNAAQLEGLDWSMIEHARLCYFEQLAVLPGPQARWHGQFLALESIVKAMQSHDICFATVVTHPIRNEAAVPYLKRAGFQLIGSIDEVYPQVGAIHSDIYLLTQEGFQAFMQSLGEKFRKRLHASLGGGEVQNSSGVSVSVEEAGLPDTQLPIETPTTKEVNP